MKLPAAALFLLLALFASVARAANPFATADVVITFTAKQGPPESATLPAAEFTGATLTVPLDLANALRLVEITPIMDDEKDKAPTSLTIAVLDPGTMLPGAPNVSPHPMTLMSTTIKFQAGADIVFFRTSLGDWSIKFDNLAKP